MKEYERQSLLDRVNRDGSTVGASIPEHIEVQGDPMSLRREIWSLRNESHDTTARRRELTIALRRERSARLQRLETDAISRASGVDLAESIIGIDRALEVLSGIAEDEDIESEIHRREVAETERWHAFLTQARGEGSKRRHR